MGIDSATDPLPLPLRRRKYYVYRRGIRIPTTSLRTVCTVVSADFQPRCGVKIGTLPRNRLASSATGGASTVSSGVLWVLSFAIERKYPAGGKKRKATGNISRRRHVPYEKGPAGRKAPVGDTTQKYSSASEMLPTQKGTCHGTFLFAGHFFVSVVIRLLPCFSFAPQGRGCCWVMQWILPPPKATSRVCTPTTSRSGNISCT